MSRISQENAAARAEIRVALDALLAHETPTSELERAERLDAWERVGNALRELWNAEDRHAVVLRDLDQVLGTARQLTADEIGARRR